MHHLAATEMWTDALWFELPVNVIYFDLQAFDLVPLAQLFTKLEPYEISGRLLDWIQYFLANCKQNVFMGPHLHGLRCQVAYPKGLY